MQTLPGNTEGQADCNYCYLDSDNIHDVEWLHKTVYGKAPAPQRYAQKYSVVFSSMPPMGLVVYSAGVVAAFLGAIPCRLSYNEQIFWAAQLTDGMVHPDHRGMKLYIRLVNTISEICAGQGADIVFGFPNQNAFPQFLTQPGWVHSETLDRFQIEVNTLSLARYGNHFQQVRKIYDRYVNAQLKAYSVNDFIVNSVINDGNIGVCRDEAYLKYKSYAGCTILAFGEAKVWLKINVALFIGDIECLPQNFDQLIKDLKRFAFKLGITTIHFQVSAGTSLHQLLALDFSTYKGFPVVLKQMNSKVLLEKMKFTFADIDVF